MSEWQPSWLDYRLGQENYIRYIGGMTILNNPYTRVAEGLLGGMADEDIPRAVVHAEQLMYDGLRGVIMAANGRGKHHPWTSIENRFQQALPHMIEIVDGTYEQYAGRLERINPAYGALRPAPMYEEATYHHLCHANKSRLRTMALMDGIRPAAVFLPILTGRKLQAGRASA